MGADSDQASSFVHVPGGIVIGPGVRTEKVFAAAMKKFAKRFESYRPLMMASSMHTRIVIANVFLLPLLYYLPQFYIAHYGLVVVPARGKPYTRPYIVSFHGTSISYSHLLLPRSKGGPFTPLRDFWCTNLAMLATETELEVNDGLPIPAMGVKSHEHWPLTQAKGDAMTKCMVPSGHAAHAGFTYMNYFCDRGAGHCINLVLEALPGRRGGSSFINTWPTEP